MILPPRLRRGDAIRIVAPSGPVPRDDFAVGAAVLAERYRLLHDDRIFSRDGFLAGPDEARLAELAAAFADREARAIVMARGGYGLLRLLPFLEPDLVRRNPKPVVGFSDGTALLAWVARAGVASIHGPVVTQLGRLAEVDRQGLFDLLEQPGGRPLFEGLEELVPGRARGPLLGGNLEVFSRLVGTPYMPDLHGAILFIEDLGERPYRVDRLITHLDLAGVWSRVAGVVVGDFSGCFEPEATRNDVPAALDVVRERLGRLTIPVLLGAPIGHGTRNLAVGHGAEVEIDTRQGQVFALEGAVL